MMDNFVELEKNNQETDSDLSDDDHISFGNFSDEFVGHYPNMERDLPMSHLPDYSHAKLMKKTIPEKNNQINLLTQNKFQEKSPKSTGESNSKEDQIKILEEKLFQTNNRLFKCKNTCFSLRQQINKAQKIISEEIGEHVTIANLSNHCSNWKGRNQQIQQLQHRVIQLQNRLNEYEKTSRPSSTPLTMKRDSLDSNKSKVQNNQFTNTLYRKSRVHTVENKYHDKKIDMKNKKERIQPESMELKNELNIIKYQVEQLQIKPKEQETEIETLKLEDTGSKLEQSCQFDLNIIPMETTNCDINGMKNDQKSNEYVLLTLASALKSLLELITILNQRLDKERNDTDHLSQLYDHEKQKNFKLESRIHQLEMAQTSKINTGYKKKNSQSILQLSSTDKELNLEQMQYKLEFLEEKCLTLKTRLTTLNQEKHQDFMLYKQMIEQSKILFQNAYRDDSTSEKHSTAVTI